MHEHIPQACRELSFFFQVATQGEHRHVHGEGEEALKRTTCWKRAVRPRTGA